MLCYGIVLGIHTVDLIAILIFSRIWFTYILTPLII